MSVYGYPKGRDVIVKVAPISRTDSSTLKMFLPKGAVVAFVMVHQQANAVTAAASYNLGWSGATTALLNAFSLPTTSVGLVTGGTATGTGVMTTPLAQDQQVIGTFGGGSSAGGTGYVIVGYYLVGPGETLDA